MKRSGPASGRRSKPGTTTIVIPGVPEVKGRPRGVIVGGCVRFYTPQKTRKYEDRVAAYGRQQISRTFDEPVAVQVDVFRPNRKRVDIDNACKAVLDGLNGVAYTDDHLIYDLIVHKRYDKANPRAEVHITHLGTDGWSPT
jgi:Holliday junction resolvase RusA-like endonuclease